jgi:hypothetical protein
LSGDVGGYETYVRGSTGAVGEYDGDVGTYDGDVGEYDNNVDDGGYDGVTGEEGGG